MSTAVHSCLLIGLAVTGCVSTPTRPPGPIPPIPGLTQKFETYSFQFLDERPADEKTKSRGSLNRNACSYGISRLADVPELDQVAYLRDRLQQDAGTALMGKTVRLKSFSAHLNMQARIRGGGMPGGALAQGVYRVLDSLNCWPDETQPGGYDVRINPNKLIVIVVAILVDVDSREYRAHEATLPDSPDPEAAFLQMAIQRAVDELVASLAAIGTVPP